MEWVKSPIYNSVNVPAMKIQNHRLKRQCLANTPENETKTD